MSLLPTILVLLVVAAPVLGCLPGLGLGGAGSGCCPTAAPACGNPCARPIPGPGPLASPVFFAPPPIAPPPPPPPLPFPLPSSYATFGKQQTVTQPQAGFGPAFGGYSQGFPGAPNGNGLSPAGPGAAYSTGAVAAAPHANLNPAYANPGPALNLPTMIQPLPLLGQPIGSQFHGSYAGNVGNAASFPQQVQSYNSQSLSPGSYVEEHEEQPLTPASGSVQSQAHPHDHAQVPAKSSQLTSVEIIEQILASESVTAGPAARPIVPPSSQQNVETKFDNVGPAVRPVVPQSQQVSAITDPAEKPIAPHSRQQVHATTDPEIQPIASQSPQQVLATADPQTPIIPMTPHFAPNSAESAIHLQTPDQSPAQHVAPAASSLSAAHVTSPSQPSVSEMRNFFGEEQFSQPHPSVGNQEHESAKDDYDNNISAEQAHTPSSSKVESQEHVELEFKQTPEDPSSEKSSDAGDDYDSPPEDGEDRIDVPRPSPVAPIAQQRPQPSPIIPQSPHISLVAPQSQRSTLVSKTASVSPQSSQPVPVASQSTQPAPVAPGDTHTAPVVPQRPHTASLAPQSPNPNSTTPQNVQPAVIAAQSSEPAPTAAQSTEPVPSTSQRPPAPAPASITFVDPTPGPISPFSSNNAEPNAQQPKTEPQSAMVHNQTPALVPASASPAVAATQKVETKATEVPQPQPDDSSEHYGKQKVQAAETVQVTEPIAVDDSQDQASQYFFWRTL